MLFYKIKSLQRRLIAKKYGFLASLYLTANPFALANGEILMRKEKNLIFFKNLGKKFPTIISSIVFILLIYYVITFSLEVYGLYAKNFYIDNTLNEKHALTLFETIVIVINKNTFLSL